MILAEDSARPRPHPRSEDATHPLPRPRQRPEVVPVMSLRTAVESVAPENENGNAFAAAPHPVAEENNLRCSLGPAVATGTWRIFDKRSTGTSSARGANTAKTEIAIGTGSGSGIVEERRGSRRPSRVWDALGIGMVGRTVSDLTVVVSWSQTGAESASAKRIETVVVSIGAAVVVVVGTTGSATVIAIRAR